MSMPSGTAEVMRLTGAGGPVSIHIGSTGVFTLRSGMVDDLAMAKMSTNVVYRVGVAVGASGSTAGAGFSTGAIPTLTESAPWTPGGLDTLLIGTNDPAFDFRVDDVLVSTEAPK
jgi:hypothetical protein